VIEITEFRWKVDKVTINGKGVTQMSIAQISPNSVFANPAHVNPLAQSARQTAVPQINQLAQNTIEKTKTDTVTISPQAMTMNSKLHSPAEETPENAAQRTAGRDRGRG
jgi:hypothetical protein